MDQSRDALELNIRERNRQDYGLVVNAGHRVHCRNYIQISAHNCSGAQDQPMVGSLRPQPVSYDCL